MAEVVTMPRLSDTMTEGVVAKWHKKIGDPVKEGDLLAEIETDKATMEFESFQEGALLYIGVEEGGSAAVDSILAILGNKGEDVQAILADHKTGGSGEAKEAPAQNEDPVPTPQHREASPSGNDQRLKASPLAKRIAEERGIDLSGIRGSGDGGRIVKRDLEQAAAPETTTTPHVFTAPAGTESFREVPVSQMRKTIARRLAESKFSAPHFYLTMEIDMDAAVAARKAMNETAAVKVSFNDMVIKAAALALRKHPAVNSSWLGDKIRYNDHVHMGVAVAVEDGLLVPVVRFADTKGLEQISSEVKVLAEKAKTKKLQPSEWEGNTFTISNLGMFGIDEFTAIINPPDSCILAIGGIAEKPVVKNGQIVPGNVMKVTLSCDHRVVDGATGSAFLQTFKALLESPVRMLL